MINNHVQNVWAQMDGEFILASRSPRRAQLLSLIGLRFKVVPSEFDESTLSETDPVKHVLKSSLIKAQDVAGQLTGGTVIGADTVVVLDGCILGKPVDAAHASEMLHRLSGRTHEVYTGFTLIQIPGYRTVSNYEMTRVRFRELDEWEMADYIDSKNPMDKAGAYGIQDQSAVFVDRIEGCFYNVVGFPLTKFYQTCLDFFMKEQVNRGE
jgi:septum formation protein